MKSFAWMDKYHKLDAEFRDIDTMGELFDYAERDEIERKMKEVKRELRGGGKT